MDCSPPGSSVHGIFQTRIVESYHFIFQGIFLTQGSNVCLLDLLHWQVDFLPLAPPGKHFFLRGGRLYITYQNLSSMKNMRKAEWVSKWVGPGRMMEEFISAYFWGMELKFISFIYFSVFHECCTWVCIILQSNKIINVFS